MTSLESIAKAIRDRDIAAIRLERNYAALVIEFDGPKPPSLCLHNVVAIHMLRQALSDWELPPYTVLDVRLARLCEAKLSPEMRRHWECCLYEGAPREDFAQRLVHLRIDGDYWIEAIGRGAEVCEGG